ncbi:hypothetical protein [Flavobacterium rhizosphaerae]|uniref:Histidine kinase N-terminal 7TM region domain-containing protein n=1 Tax=Flavobacterium rhizosphaerae TaxID=3163298 RepID=A0ABW8YV87_9FLAO
MEIVAETLKLYEVTIIHNLYISLLTVKLFSCFLAKEAYTISKQIIRWLIISSGGLSILSWIIYLVTANNMSYSSRATGPYAAMYWLLIFFSCMLPFVLLFKKFKYKGWAIFLVALLINTGWLFERFVIIVTSLHRDYLPSSWSIYNSFEPLLTTLIRGVLIGFFL